MLSEGADVGNVDEEVTDGNFASGQAARKGQIVRSVRGRDKGRLYLVMGTSGDGFVLVADGVHRSVNHPKRKNPRHLRIYDATAERINKALSAGQRVSNTELMQALSAQADSSNENGEEVDDTG